MSLRITILGCGSSGGVPRIGGNWGLCDPSNPRNRRRRCSALVQRMANGGTSTALVDTGPDLREQLLDAGVGWLDGVIFTHSHADHVHGVDELRVVAINGRRRVNIWADEPTMSALRARFSYCFETPPGSGYPPILEPHPMRPLRPVSVPGPGGVIEALPFELEHGDITALGLRFADVAYTPDVSGIPQESLPMLQELDVWIVDALRRDPHPSHWHLAETLRWIEHLAPRRAVLTNMHVDLDYETLKRELPANVEPAFDGMVIEA